MTMTVTEIRRAVWQRLGVWLTAQQVRWWAREGKVRAERDAAGEWRLDDGATIDAVREGRLGKDGATSREQALVRAVTDAARAAGVTTTLREERAAQLLATAEGAPAKLRHGKRGPPKNGPAASLGANIKEECGVTLDRRLLKTFFDVS